MAAHHVSLILKEFPSSNEFPQWNWGAVGRSKVEPASIHPLALPGNQIQYIFEVPSLKKKKKSHQPLMGLIHPQENSFLKIHYFPSARVLSLKGQVK